MLELACGTGNYTTHWTKHFTVVATDISKDMIERAKAKNIAASFKVMPMQKLNVTEKYDVITCMWESFRYLKSHEDVDDVLKKIYAALKPKGVFVADWHHFSPGPGTDITRDPIQLHGKTVVEKTHLWTDGDYDMRTTKMQVTENGKTKTVDVKRSPFLRISPERMKKYLSRNGFINITVHNRFVPVPQSYVFIAQKP